MRGGIGFWGAGKQNYLLGNAKIYDGSFDYDTLSFSQFERTQPFSMFFASQINSATDQVIAGTHKSEGGGGSNRGWNAAFLNISGSVYFGFQLLNTGANRLLMRVNTPTTIGAKNVFVVTYDGSSLAAGMKFFVNGVQVATTTITNNLTGTIIATDPTLTIGRLNPNTGVTVPFNGLLKQFEITNRVATPAEILAASNAGSFRGAGISHSSGQYLLAVDFDKTGTVAPTTYAGTPTYTITSFGGASYTPYL